MEVTTQIIDQRKVESRSIRAFGTPLARATGKDGSRFDVIVFGGATVEIHKDGVAGIYAEFSLAELISKTCGDLAAAIAEAA
jgi:hypothetical protein